MLNKLKNAMSATDKAIAAEDQEIVDKFDAEMSDFVPIPQTPPIPARPQNDYPAPAQPAITAMQDTPDRLKPNEYRKQLEADKMAMTTDIASLKKVHRVLTDAIERREVILDTIKSSIKTIDKKDTAELTPVEKRKATIAAKKVGKELAKEN